MSQAKGGGARRILILTLNLLNTRTGLSAKRLLELVPGYDTAQQASAERKLECDLATLRKTGLNVKTLPTFPPRYLIDTKDAGGPPLLTSEEFRLLRRGSEAWTGLARTQAGVVLNKLRAVTDGPTNALPARTALPLEGGAYTAVLHEAITDARPISFDYESKNGLENREVAPWNLVARGSALYLWGFDLNRWAPRLFRLSRFRSDPEMIAPSQATLPIGALAPREFDHDSFLVAPLLAVRVGGAPLVRAKSGPAAAQNTELPQGWEVLQGTQGDVGAWEASLLREATDVVVLKPDFLAQTVMEALEAAAGFGGSDG